MVRRMRLFQLATCVIDKVACTEEARKILEDILNNAILDIKSTLKSGGSGEVSERNNVVQHVYNEPLAVRAKGDSVCNNDTINLTAKDEDSISTVTN
ncbi:hypothetical protein Ddye_013016 [Dipteronia dyeriana]|uniref:Uncharacterized protein n=1 Tax=Dipteronia dyeriana TaxID=168575 RepID=A0AAD9X5E0_9ROSI|nr:hypothetical protein Ddye_013016 [Dipteronia dyeriana]